METRHLGLTRIARGEDFTKNDWAYTGRDRDLIDLVFAALLSHDHTGATLAPPSPPNPPVTGLIPDTPGALPAGETIHYRVTHVDALGLESEPSTTVTQTTATPLDVPTAPAVARQSNAGALPPGRYQYSLTAWRNVWVNDTQGGIPGVANLPTAAGAEQAVILTLPPLPPGADGFNIYRLVPGSSQWNFLATIAADDVGTPFVDDGSITPDAERTLPAMDRSANATSIGLDLSGSAVLGPNESFRVYRSFDGINWDASMIADTGDTTFIDSGQASIGGAPPENGISLEMPGPLTPAPVPHVFMLGNGSTPVTPGPNDYMASPVTGELTEIRMSLNAPSASGDVTVAVNQNGNPAATIVIPETGVLAVEPLDPAVPVTADDVITIEVLDDGDSATGLRTYLTITTGN